jgi:hypothetical protein
MFQKISQWLWFFYLQPDQNAGKLNKTLVHSLPTGHYSPGLMNILDDADPAPVSGLMILTTIHFSMVTSFMEKMVNR